MKNEAVLDNAICVDSKTIPTVEVITNNSQQALSWNKTDTTWVLSIFGTAVGAGILFLPINAGLGGFWPLMVMTIVIAPLTFLTHRALSLFVLSSASRESDITDVVEEHFGVGAGKLMTFLYVMAIYPIVLIYSIAMTNTVSSFMVNQLNLATPDRWLLSFVLISFMVLVVVSGEKFMLKVTQLMVYPLVLSLFFISVYLIPQWRMASLQFIPAGADFSLSLWLTLPVLVFSFNFSPAISCFSVAQRRQYGSHAEKKSTQIILCSSVMLVFFIMFFVFSVVLSLTPADLIEAKQHNISILSYMANHHSSPWFLYLSPVIAFTAIVSSFFGHYLGAREGLAGLVHKQAKAMGKTLDARRIDQLIVGFMFISAWVVAAINPGILVLIESLAGPIIASILFLMPMYAINKIPALKKYRRFMVDCFVTIMGIIVISAILYQLF